MSLRRSWPGRLHRVVRRTETAGLSAVTERGGGLRDIEIEFKDLEAHFLDPACEIGDLRCADYDRFLTKPFAPPSGDIASDGRGPFRPGDPHGVDYVVSVLAHLLNLGDDLDHLLDKLCVIRAEPEEGRQEVQYVGHGDSGCDYLAYS